MHANIIMHKGKCLNIYFLLSKLNEFLNKQNYIYKNIFCDKKLPENI